MAVRQPLIWHNVILHEVRFAYPFLFEPQLPKDDPSKPPKYAVHVMIPNHNEEDLDACHDTINAVADEAVAKGLITLAIKEEGLQLPLRDGTKEVRLERKKPEFIDHTFFVARSKTQPEIIDIYNRDLRKHQVEFYPGVWGKIDVGFYFTTEGGTPRIAAGLNNVLKTRDDERFGNRSKAKDVFSKYLKEAPKNMKKEDRPSPFKK